MVGMVLYYPIRNYKVDLYTTYVYILYKTVSSYYNMNSPSVPFPSGIILPFSRFHVIFGAGEPDAAHLSETLLPSGTTLSVLVG